MTGFISKYINSRKKMNLITKYEVGDMSIVGYSLFFDRHAKTVLSLSLPLSLSLSLLIAITKSSSDPIPATFCCKLHE